MEKFLAAVRNMFNVPDLRKRIFFTLGLLAIYRLGAHISTPGINRERLDQVWHDVSGTLLGVLDLFSGGNFRTISVFALGVTPYITASIIMQLMPVLSPAVKKIQEDLLNELAPPVTDPNASYASILAQPAGHPPEP